MPEPKTTALMARVTPEARRQLEELCTAWGSPGKPMSLASALAMAIHRAHEREVKPGRRKGKAGE